MACRSISPSRRVRRTTIGCVRFFSAHCFQKPCYSRIADTVAPPGFLGDLREELPKGLKDKVVDEITSDLTNLPQQQLQTHLKDILGPST
jgi:hypothetical protein